MNWRLSCRIDANNDEFDINGRRFSGGLHQTDRTCSTLIRSLKPMVVALTLAEAQKMTNSFRFVKAKQQPPRAV